MKVSFKKIVSVTLSLSFLVLLPVFTTQVFASGYEERIMYVVEKSFDFNNDVNTKLPVGFTGDGHASDTYPTPVPAVPDMGKVYQPYCYSTARAVYVKDMVLPTNFEISVKTAAANITNGANVAILTDGNYNANNASFLFVRFTGAKKITIYANDGSSSNVTEDFLLNDLNLTLENNNWYGIRAVVEDDVFSLYISSNGVEYEVVSEASVINNRNIKKIREKAKTAGFRPYGSDIKCQYDDFVVKFGRPYYAYECEDNYGDSVDLTVANTSASNEKFVKFEGNNPGEYVDITVTPPATGLFDISLVSGVSPDNAKLRLDIIDNGSTTSIGEVNQYSESSGFFEKGVGRYDFTSTNSVTFRMTVLEKPPGESDYVIDLDCINLFKRSSPYLEATYIVSNDTTPNLTNLTPSDTIKVSGTLKNTSSIEQIAKMLVCLFADDYLEEVYIVDIDKENPNAVIPVNKSHEFEVEGIQLPEYVDDKYMLKVFFWDNLEDIVPQTEPFVILGY